MTNPLDRRTFLKTTVAAGAALGLGTLPAFASAEAKPLFKISLAEWSLHRTLREGKLDNLDFPAFSKKEFDIDAVECRLVDQRAGLIRLLDPPFDKLDHDPGYIMGYVPGVRENGGQYTHGVLWFIRAMAELGRGSRAVELLEMLNPINHTRTPSEVGVYQAEPYVVAADVYSQPPHVGRAGWTWYTGSAGWMWRVAVESILGLQVVGGRELRLNPCIAADWPSCSIQYRLPDGATTYVIELMNPRGKQRGITSATVDGTAASVEDGMAFMPLQADGREHRVTVTL